MSEVTKGVEELAHALCVVDSSLNPTTALDMAQSRKDMERATRLINWMAGYLKHMAPGYYSECYAELNDHFLAVERMGATANDPSKPKGEG